MTGSDLNAALLGARMSMRDAARQLLEIVDQMTEGDVRASGWASDELASLERLAAMPIAGVGFGKWPRTS